MTLLIKTEKFLETLVFRSNMTHLIRVYSAECHCVHSLLFFLGGGRGVVV
jgi:hypothetical protein